MTLIKPKHRHRARRLVLQALYQWQVSGNSLHDIETTILIDNQDKAFDREYVQQFLRGIPQELADTDSLFLGFLDRKLEEITPIELAILRMGVYELKHRLDVPYKVVLNEAVELCKLFGATESHKYINGVLDKAAHQLRKEEL
jgi:N utilization substance protein B